MIERIRSGEEIPLAEFTRGLDPISQSIVEYGGLFNYNKARLAGETEPPALETTKRPMNIVEKIIARHAFVRAGEVGVEAVKPGDALFAVADVRFSHEYVTPMAESRCSSRRSGSDARVTEAESVYAFRDHLTFLGRVMPEEKRKMGLLERADGLAVTQADFTEEQGIRLYGGTVERGSEAICHNAVVEDIALPGQLVIGTDSHTCMAGVLGCFAFGVGSTDMANAWYTKDIRVKVPETVKFVLKGEKRADVSAKDVMLVILATDYMKEGKGIGQVLEFAGEGLKDWPIDERATLTNMAVEAGGFTGIIEPDETVVAYLKQARGLDEETIRAGFLRSDRGRRVRRQFRDRPRGDSPDGRHARRPAQRRPRDGVRRACQDRHRLRRLLHGRQDGRHGHVRGGLESRGRAGPQGRARRASVSTVRLAEDQGVRARARLHRAVRARRGGADRPFVRRVHQRRAGRLEVSPSRSRSARRTATSPAAAAPARSISPALTSSPPRPSRATSSNPKSS